MRALVTGATGFLGTWLTAELAKAGHKIVRLVRDRTFVEAGVLNRVYGMTDVFGDILDGALLERVMAEYEIDTIFHLAAQAQVTTGQADPTGTLDINIRGTWNVLEAARRQKVRRIVVASSDKAYGRGPVPYLETTPLAGRSPYEVSKSCTDLLAQTYAATYGMSVGIARCSNLYGGGHLNWSTLIPGTIKKLWNGQRPVVYGGGIMVREFLYVEDAVRAYIALATKDIIGPFNFGGGEPKPIIQVVRRLVSLMHSNLEPEVKDENRGEICDQFLDSSKAERHLGWKPKVKFDDGLRLTVKWFTEFFMTKGDRVCV